MRGIAPSTLTTPLMALFVLLAPLRAARAEIPTLLRVFTPTSGLGQSRSGCVVETRQGRRGPRSQIVTLARGEQNISPVSLGVPAGDLSALAKRQGELSAGLIGLYTAEAPPGRIMVFEGVGTHLRLEHGLLHLGLTATCGGGVRIAAVGAALREHALPFAPTRSKKVMLHGTTPQGEGFRAEPVAGNNVRLASGILIADTAGKIGESHRGGPALDDNGHLVGLIIGGSPDGRTVHLLPAEQMLDQLHQLAPAD